MQVIVLPICGIRLELHSVPDATADDPTTARPLVTGVITSDLHESRTCDSAEDDAEIDLHNARCDGLESLILACACAGIDVELPAFQEAIETAVDAIGNAD